MKWYQDKIFWGIITACALVKLAAFAGLYYFNPLGEQALIFPDSLGYVYPAQTWLTYGAFWEAVSASPLLLRTPGYPVFIALAQLLTHSATWGVVFWQNVLSVILLLPVYLTAKHLAGQTAARWAAGCCAVSVLYFSLAFAVLTETVCVFLLAWFVYLTVRWIESQRGKFLLGAAVLLAAAIYVRPAVYYFAPVCAGLLILLAWKEKSTALLKQTLLCFVLPVLGLVSAWHVRNYVQTGYSGFTSVGAYNLYIWNEDFVAKQNNIPVWQAYEKLLAALPENFNSLPAKTQVALYKKFAAPLLKQSFMHKLSRAPVWATKTLFGPNQTHLARLFLARADEPEKTLGQVTLVPRPWLKSAGEKIIFIAAFLEVIFVVLLGLWGVYLLYKTHPLPAVFLAAYIGYFWLLGSGFLGAYARMRAPFEFVLCITAGLAMQKLLQKTPPALTRGAQ